VDQTLAKLRVAIVHEWFVDRSGSERVVEQILNIVPQADLYAVVDFLPEDLRWFIRHKPVRTTFIQQLPGARKRYRSYLPLMPLAIEQHDLSSYDVVVSSSHAVAKGVLTGPDQLHISYVHSPMRYAWDLQHQYLKEAGLDRGMKAWLARWVLHRARSWDYRTANGVDHFVANSAFIARRIWKTYRREATVIYPPVDTANFALEENKEDYYLTASRMVPYKKVGVIVDAFARMPDKKLVVIGDGPEYAKVVAKGKANVAFLGYQGHRDLRRYMERARAFVFAAEEDFGITPVEALACGTPVLAYGKGGALESVRGLDQPHPTGLFFGEQTPEAIVDAVERFEVLRCRIDPIDCRKRAEQFSQERFVQEFRALMLNLLAARQPIRLGRASERPSEERQKGVQGGR